LSDYDVDVFISYSRSSAVEPWVRNHFYPQLKKWLDQSLPNEVDIFVDYQMPVGVPWPATLKHKLSRSRCLVAILSPPYFRSQWCLSEWRTMEERERRVGAGPGRPIEGLIYPIRFFDGQHFPPFASTRQRRDFANYNRDTPAFSSTRDYDDFVREVQVVATDLATIIANAPQWDASWPLLEEPHPVSLPTVAQPRL
jgi:hypothetical protein